MIIDVTGIELTPGEGGKYCAGNGEHIDENGILLECCCDECDYMICCLIMKCYEKCRECSDDLCPHSKINRKNAEEPYP